jgi:hypothetical protein
LVIAAFVFTQPVFAQTEYARSDQFGPLSEDLATNMARIQESLDAMTPLSDSQNVSGDAQLTQLTAIFDVINAEARRLNDIIKPTSPFLSALEAAHAEAVVLLRREERAPPSPSRGARIARLTASMARIDEHHSEILAAHNILNGMIETQLPVPHPPLATVPNPESLP